MKNKNKKKRWGITLILIFLGLLGLGGICSQFVDIPNNTNQTKEVTKTKEAPKTEKVKETKETKQTIEPKKSDKVTMKNLSDLKILDRSVIDFTIDDNKGYNDVLDIAITVNEEKKEINMTVKVKNDLRMDLAKSSSDQIKARITAQDEAKSRVEDIAKQLAFNTYLADSSYSKPNKDDLGGLYKEYKLVINLSNANKIINLCGTKKVSKNKIDWEYVYR